MATQWAEVYKHNTTAVYAKYFVKYIQAMKAKGINIDAITVQNEPLHGGNNPSMVMKYRTSSIYKKSFGPAFNVDMKHYYQDCYLGS